MTITITDSHCHLDFPDFDEERSEIITRAVEAGVTRMVTICTRLRNEPQVRAIAEAHAPVFYAAGTHPMSAAEEPHKAKPYTCVMHCFSSSAELGRAALDLGFYLSMSGIAAFPKSQELRDIFATAPLDRILVETDSPYLAPPPFRGKRNEPSYVVNTAKIGADVFGLRYEEFAKATEANFDRLFSKAVQAPA